jgi:hypothetical protein
MHCTCGSIIVIRSSKPACPLAFGYVTHLLSDGTSCPKLSRFADAVWLCRECSEGAGRESYVLGDFFRADVRSQGKLQTVRPHRTAQRQWVVIEAFAKAAGSERPQVRVHQVTCCLTEFELLHWEQSIQTIHFHNVWTVVSLAWVQQPVGCCNAWASQSAMQPYTLCIS